MVIFNSYIGLLEGSILNDRTTECTTGYWGWKYGVFDADCPNPSTAPDLI